MTLCVCDQHSQPQSDRTKLHSGDRMKTFQRVFLWVSTAFRMNIADPVLKFIHILGQFWTDPVDDIAIANETKPEIESVRAQLVGKGTRILLHIFNDLAHRSRLIDDEDNVDRDAIFTAHHVERDNRPLLAILHYDEVFLSERANELVARVRGRKNDTELRKVCDVDVFDAKDHIPVDRLKTKPSGISGGRRSALLKVARRFLLRVVQARR